MIDAKDFILEGVSEIKELNNYLCELGIIDDCKFTSTLARGLSIYTGLVFEFYDKKQKLTCAIGAGGRYNKIITNFMDNGQEYPAVGLSFGLEPIYVILKEEMKDETTSDIYMVPLDTNVDVLRLATSLRSIGYRVLIEMNKRKIGKCFEYAERNNIPFVMIIGNDEVTSGKYKIKDMNKKEEYTLSSDELVDFLKKNK
jgi:histidyl-tRNA synthetase